MGQPPQIATHRTRRTGSHKAHFAVHRHSAPASEPDNTFHSALHHNHTAEHANRPDVHETKRAAIAASTQCGAPVHQTDVAGHGSLEEDIESMEAASEEWIKQYSAQMNSGHGLSAVTVFGRNTPVSEPLGSASAAAILNDYGT